MAGIGWRRPIVHLPVVAMNAVAGVLENLPDPPLTRGLIGFALCGNTSRGVNADAALGLTFRAVDTGIREVYGKDKKPVA